MRFYVWARTVGAWKIVAITREEADANAVFDLHTNAYIADDDFGVIKTKAG